MKKRKIAIIVIPIILFIILVISLEVGFLTGFEDWVYTESVEHMSPVLTKILTIITNLGDRIFIIVFCLLLLALKKTRFTYGLPISVAVIVSTSLNLTLKPIFARQRPNILQLVTEKSFSFPSGHAMMNATLYTMIAILVWHYAKNKKVKIAVAIGCALAVGCISFTRIYLGVHYVTDILAGIFAGFVVAIAVYEFLKWANILKDTKDEIKQIENK